VLEWGREERRNESLKNFFIYSFDGEHCFTLDTIVHYVHMKVGRGGGRRTRRRMMRSVELR
jgi:hypothetical protein